MGELLREIRDIQRDHLAEYKRVTQQSLELQQRAVLRQESVARLYQRVIAVAAVVVAAGIAVVTYALMMRAR